MHITKKVFGDLAVCMISLGFLVGILFPFFMLLIGIPEEAVLTPFFFVSCIIAGVFVGAINIYLAYFVVGRRLRLLADRMKFVDSKISSGLTSTQLTDCSETECLIPIDSDDVLGETASSFNDLVRTLSNSIRNERSIKEYNEMLSNKLELNGLTTNALSHILRFTNAEAGAILYEEGGELVLSASQNIETPNILCDDPTVFLVMSTKKRQILSLPENIAISTTLVTFKPSEVIVEPLTYKDLVIGVVISASSRQFNKDNLYGYEMFIRGISLALRNAITHNQLQRLAANDPLTGIYNRRFGMVRLDEEFNRSIRSSLPLGVIMFDIDHFKSFNDTYGHLTGDHVLVSATKEAKKAIREGDLLIRYGGEEFLVILPGASFDDTKFVADRIVRMINDNRIHHAGQELHITVSAGFTSYPENEISGTTELIESADKALYAAKDSGRNKTFGV